MKAGRGRVLHLIDTTGPGGAETVFLQLADGLRQRGWDSRAVVVGAGWVLDQVREIGLGVDVVRTRGRLDFGYLLALRALIRRHRIQLIQAHLFSPAVYASAIGAITSTPVIATLHGSSDTTAPGIGGRLRYQLLERRARVVCVSETLRDELLSRQRLSVDTVSVVHNGVDVDIFAAADGTRVREELGVSARGILVGALGNVRPAKDYATFIRAAATLAADERFHFVIAGERTQPLYGELLELRNELRLESRVQFIGFREDVPDLLAGLDTLVISSSSEGFSLAALQAMAAGTPVVATRSGGPQGILTDEEDGLLVPVRSPQELAAAVRRLADDPALASGLRTRARETVREQFSLSAMLDRYERLYAESLSADESQSDATPPASSSERSESSSSI